MILVRTSGTRDEMGWTVKCGVERGMGSVGFMQWRKERWEGMVGVFKRGAAFDC